MDLWSRRELLKTFAAAAAIPQFELSRLAPRRRVGIVGAGIAGVSLAWLLDGQRDVVLIEAAPEIGGNVRSVEVELDGASFVVDMGAQYFHPGPYPTYTTLLRRLGFYPPSTLVPRAAHTFPATITVDAAGEATPRFVSPLFFDRLWPLLTPWNWAGVWAFAIAFPAARAREQADERWDLTLEDWLPTLGLTREQWEGMLLPWAASLYSGDIDEARSLSARAAMIFAAKALPPNPLAPVEYYVLNGGLVQPLQRMLAQCSTVRVLTGAPVERVAREPRGGFTIRCKGRAPIVVDDLVFASSGPGTRALLGTMPGTQAQRQAVGGIEFRGARLALHTDPIYARAETEQQSFLNCRIQDGYCEASMHLDTIVTDAPPATARKLWKSWVTHRAMPPSEVLHEADYQHMLPSVATLKAQTAVAGLQGRDGVWFAGGYLHPYDAQESALRSALDVAAGLKVTTPRWHALAG